MAEFPDLELLFPENNLEFRQSDARPLMKSWQVTNMQMPGGLPTAVFAIENGILTPTQSACRVDTEGQGPLDELELIATSGIHNGAEITLLAADAARAVTLKHKPNAVNGIALAGGADKALSVDGFITLKREGDRWVERVSASVAQPPGVPGGGIILWSGTVAGIPTGWALCDGQNGTPDLRDKFIIGSGGSKTTGASGGAKKVTATVDATTLTAAQMPSHRHTIPCSGAVGGTAGFGYDAKSVTGNYNSDVTGGGGSHTHTLTSTAESNLPPYYALAYIMKL